LIAAVQTVLHVNGGYTDHAHAKPHEQ